MIKDCPVVVCAWVVVCGWTQWRGRGEGRLSAILTGNAVFVTMVGTCVLCFHGAVRISFTLLKLIRGVDAIFLRRQHHKASLLAVSNVRRVRPSPNAD